MTLPEKPFVFLRPPTMTDQELTLVLERQSPPDPARAHVPGYHFKMVLSSGDEKIGGLRLRIGSDDALFYPGHLGYDVELPFRGHHYAERACRLASQLARQHGLDHLVITCDPENVASRRTCARLGAHLLGVVEIPPEHEMYEAGKRRVLRYRWDI